eukprot:jgi/Chrzof1/6895/Cz02g02140.t1
MLLQATARFFSALVGGRGVAPVPTEVIRPAGQSRDVYRLLHENVAAMRGHIDAAGQQSPEEVKLRDATGGLSIYFSLFVCSAMLSAVECIGFKQRACYFN